MVYGSSRGANYFAEKLFKYFLGSFFHMGRERYYEVYEKFQVPREIERKWLGDLVKYYYDKFNKSEDWKSIHHFSIIVDLQLIKNNLVEVDGE